MNEMRKLMEAVKQLDESTRQEVAGWEDYDPEEIYDPDEWEWETDPKILAYDEENRRLHKKLFDEEQLNEDPTADGRMRALYGDLSKVIRNAEVIQTDFEKYPALGEYKKIAVEVFVACRRLRQIIGDVLN